MEKILFIAGILSLLAAGMIALWTRRQLILYTSRISDCLDAMINGKENIQFDEQSDTLLAKIQVKLRRLYEILTEQSGQSRKEKMELEEIVSDLSHQVKTPIANVRMYNHILQERDLPKEKQQEFLSSIDNQIVKLDSLMQSMITISRLEVGIIEVEPKRAPLYPLIEQAVCDAALKAEQKHIQITVDCSETMKAVFDYKWTLEAVFNILDNGVKYTADGGSIRIKVTITDFFAKISIADTGKGICEAHYADIFKRFYREMDVRETDGVGIGLFLSRKIIEKQRGFIEVASKVGAGSVFSVHLPMEE